MLVSRNNYLSVDIVNIISIYMLLTITLDIVRHCAVPESEASVTPLVLHTCSIGLHNSVIHTSARNRL